MVSMLTNPSAVIEHHRDDKGQIVPYTLRVYSGGVLAFYLTAEHFSRNGYTTFRFLINGVEKARFPYMEASDAANLLNTLITSQLHEFRRQGALPLESGGEAHWVAMDKLINVIMSKKNDLFI